MSNPYAISPLDGRYYSKTRKVADYFSEFAFCKYRMKIELEYFYQLTTLELPELTLPENYTLLTEFEKASGFGVLLNTSFNVNKKPILSSYAEAIEVFKNTRMDKLILEDYYIKWKHV